MVFHLMGITPKFLHSRAFRLPPRPKLLLFLLYSLHSRNITKYANAPGPLHRPFSLPRTAPQPCPHAACLSSSFLIKSLYKRHLFLAAFPDYSIHSSYPSCLALPSLLTVFYFCPEDASPSDILHADFFICQLPVFHSRM